MSGLLDFAANNPWTTIVLSPFVLAFALVGVLAALRVVVLLLWRLMRTVMVVFGGWPPEHLDADGDWEPECEVPETGLDSNGGA